MNAQLDTTATALEPKNPTVGHLTVLPPENPAILKHIEALKVYDQGIRAAAEDIGSFVCFAGIELLGLKQVCAHGEFEKTCEQYAPEISRSARHRYMIVAQDFITKNPTVGHLVKNPPLIIDGKVEEKHKALIAKKWHDFADGRLITQIFRDTGAIRQPKQEKHTPAKEPSAKEKAEAEKAQAAQWLGAFRGKVRLYLDPDSKLHKRLSKEQREEIDGLCLMVRNFNSGKLKGAELTKAIEAIGGEEEAE